MTKSRVASFWSLMIGACLEFGDWDLVLLSVAVWSNQEYWLQR
jgi:hypothetical protein